MVGFSIFPDSQIVQMTKFSIFPDSHVLKITDDPNLHLFHIIFTHYSHVIFTFFAHLGPEFTFRVLHTFSKNVFGIHYLCIFHREHVLFSEAPVSPCTRYMCVYPCKCKCRNLNLIQQILRSKTFNTNKLNFQRKY